MKLLSLKVKNLFSIGEIELSLADRGLTLVTGFSHDENRANGAGKSSVANKAILWTLWGSSAGGLKAGKVLNRHGAKRGEGQISFIGSDNERYTVIRRRPASLTLLKNDKDVSAKTAKITQDLIDKALGIDFNTFVQTSFFGQGRDLSFPALQPREQKELLEGLLPLHEIDKWAKFTEDKVKEVKLLISTETTMKNKLEAITSTSSQNLARVKRNEEDFRLKQTRVIQALLDKKNSNVVRNLEQTIQSKQQQLKSLIIPDDFLKLQEELKTQKEQQVNLHNSLFDAKNVAAKWVQRINNLTVELKHFGQTVCPSCDREYAPEVIQEIQNKKAVLEQNLTSAQQTLDSADAAVSYYLTSLETVNNVVSTLNKTLAEKNSIIVQADKLKLEIANLQNTLLREHGDFDSLIKAERERPNPFTSEVKEVELQLENSTRDLNLNLDGLKKLESELEHLNF